MTNDTTRSLIDELERGGELVDDGAFSIDASQALTKLRNYQLADPHAWILLVVEAAALAGVEPIVIPGEGLLRIELGAIELAADELEQLFTWAFASRDASRDAAAQRRARVLELLALASNALLGLQPDAIVIESAGVRLRMTPAQPLGTLETIEGLPPGSRIEVEGIGGDAERELVRRRCRLTTLDVRVGDERVSRGPGGAIVDAGFEAVKLQGGFAPVPRTKALRDAQGQEVGRWGRAYQTSAHPTLHVVANGVTIESIDLRDEGLGPLAHELDSHFVAIVEHDLPRDISQSRVRRGPELAAIVALARKAAELEVKAPQGISRLEARPLASADTEVTSVVLLMGASMSFVVWALSMASRSWLLSICMGAVMVGCIISLSRTMRPRS